MPHCQKEFAKPPVSSKDKKAKQAAKRDADKAKAAKRAKEEEEEEAARAAAERDPAEVEAELERQRQKEKEEADAKKLKGAKMEGGKAFQAHDWETALERYTECIDLAPDDHIHWSNRSAVHKQMFNFEEALADAKKCTELKPDFAKGWARIGAAQLGLNKLEESEEAFNHGLTLEPENVMCLDGLKDVEKKREGPTEEEEDEDEVEALLKKMQNMELSDIRAKAADEGLEEARIEIAELSEEPEKALTNLVVAYKYLSNLIKAELQGLSKTQLRERALQEGVDDEVAAEASRSADACAALRSLIVKHMSNDLVDVLTDEHGEEYADSDDDSDKEPDEQVDFEVVTDETELQLDVGEVFIAGAYIDEKYGELVLPSGIRLGNRALNKYYKQRICRSSNRQLALHGSMQSRIARKAEGRLLSQNHKLGQKSQRESQALQRMSHRDNKAMRAIVHHWGAGGGGSHYHMCGGKQWNKGNKVKGVVLRHSVQGAKLQAARNKSNRGNNSVACLQ